MTTGSPRRRRSTHEVRVLIIQAAYEEFARVGFATASIRLVAERAGVTESMVFRHYSSKAELFQAAAAGPLVEFMNDFATSITAHPDQDPQDVTTQFVSGLFDLCKANRRILASVAERTSDVSSEKIEEPVFDACVDTLVRGIYRYIEEGDGRAATGDIRQTVRLTLGLILGVVLSGEQLFPTDLRDDEVKQQLARFVLYGAGYTEQ